MVATLLLILVVVGALVAVVVLVAPPLSWPGFRGDWVMEVSNQSNRVILVRVRSMPDFPDRQFVTRVGIGSDGPAVAWRGSRDVPVQALDSDCTVLATFETSDGITYTAPGIPGLSARIKGWYGFGANFTPGFDPQVGDCGGGIPSN